MSTLTIPQVIGMRGKVIGSKKDKPCLCGATVKSNCRRRVAINNPISSCLHNALDTPLEDETWIILPIEGYEKYQVSSEGRVRKKNKVGFTYRKTHITNGYYGVTLTSNYTALTKHVHRLVAIAFIENPKNKPCVNHIDGDKLNNKVSNLEWCTYAENNLHSREVLGNTKQAWGEKNSNAKFTNLEAEAIRNEFKSGGITQVSLAKKYNITRKQIYMLIYRKSYNEADKVVEAGYAVIKEEGQSNG